MYSVAQSQNVESKIVQYKNSKWYSLSKIVNKKVDAKDSQNLYQAIMRCMKIMNEIIEYPDIDEIRIWEPNANQTKYMQVV